jgi:hypothetical protein
MMPADVESRMPAMAEKVRIFRPTKTAMQSGRGRTQQWVLEFEPCAARRPEPLMGWISGSDTRHQVRLAFASRDAALAYAREHGWEAVVQEEHDRRLKPKSYADNFRPDRIRH